MMSKGPRKGSKIRRPYGYDGFKVHTCLGVGVHYKTNPVKVAYFESMLSETYVPVQYLVYSKKLNQWVWKGSRDDPNNHQ